MAVKYYYLLLLAAVAVFCGCSNGSTESRESIVGRTIVGRDNLAECENGECDSFYVNYFNDKACYDFLLSGQSDDGRSLTVEVGVDCYGYGDAYFQNEEGKWTYLEVEFGKDEDGNNVVEGYDTDGRHYYFTRHELLSYVNVY